MKKKIHLDHTTTTDAPPKYSIRKAILSPKAPSAVTIDNTQTQQNFINRMKGRNVSEFAQYSCPYCNLTKFARKNAVITHILNTHLGIERPECTLHKFGSKRAERMITHLNKHHTNPPYYLYYTCNLCPQSDPAITYNHLNVIQHLFLKHPQEAEKPGNYLSYSHYDNTKDSLSTPELVDDNPTSPNTSTTPNRPVVAASAPQLPQPLFHTLSGIISALQQDPESTRMLYHFLQTECSSSTHHKEIQTESQSLSVATLPLLLPSSTPSSIPEQHRTVAQATARQSHAHSFHPSHASRPVFSCPVIGCTHKFHYKNALYSHYIDNHAKVTHPCTICSPFTAHSLTSFMIHLQTHRFIIQPECHYKCIICNHSNLTAEKIYNYAQEDHPDVDPSLFIKYDGYISG